MKVRNIALLILALVLLATCIGTIIYFFTTVGNEIDITDSATEVFADFEQKAINGNIDALTKKEQKVTEHWGDVYALCLNTMDNIVKRYAVDSIDYDTAIRALEQYKLFPVTNGQIAAYLERVDEIKSGRDAYDDALTTTDKLQAAILFSRVSEQDNSRYTDAKNKLAAILDTDLLEDYTMEMLACYKINECLSTLKDISKMWESDNCVNNLIADVEEYKTWQEETITYKQEIEVLTVRNLMAFPEKVYREGSKYQSSYDSSLITPGEFSDILEQLYDNDYILISIEEMSDASALTGVKVPSGKTPFALIIEDLSYPSANAGSGVVDKLSLDDNGILCTVTNGVISYDNESVCILEEFINEHPDFVCRGARGCISLTGYDGVLGYRLDEEGEPEQAKQVAQFLTDKGWTFACNSFSYADMKNASYEALVEDTDTWISDIAPVVGNPTVYIWPYGSSVRSGEKHEYLYDKGFRIFCGVGTAPYRGAEPDGKGVFFDRKALNGYSLRNRRDEYAHLFDTESVLDPIRPEAVASN